MVEARILGIDIPRYKNLRDVWLPWSRGLALVGANGAGKTNVLEALVLLLGDAESRRECRARLATDEAAGLSMVLQGDLDALPIGHLSISDEDLADHPTYQLLRDTVWWRSLGVSEGQTFAEALKHWPLSEEWRQTIAALTEDPIVQVTLVALTSEEPREPYETCASCDPDGSPTDSEGGVCEFCGGTTETVPTRAQFEEPIYRRTLLAPSDFALPSSAPNAVPAFASFGAEVGPGFRAVLELPVTTRPPAVLQWLPHTRSEDQISESLSIAFEAALVAAVEFVELIAEIAPSTVSAESGDAHWWLHAIGARAANRELGLLQPSLRVDSHGGGVADWAIIKVAPDGEAVEVGHTLERPLLHLSAGERRWMDEALASAATALKRHGDMCALLTETLSEADDDTVLELLSESIDLAEQADFWTVEALDAIFQALEPSAISRLITAESATQAMRGLLRAFLPAYRFLDQPLTVRVFDEPEAHLHASAQRRVARALKSLRNGGPDVVLATHSPIFLDETSWTTVHVTQGTLSLVPSTNSEARQRVAVDLGLTHGQLLAGVERLLVVEGPHDQLVLETIWGADLRQSGTALIRLFGTDHLPALLSLDFIERYVDAPMTVMLDYTRTDRILASKWHTDEERKIVDVRKTAKRRGQFFDVLGLKMPDIICYLNEDAIRQSHPEFPGWGPILTAFSDRQHRPSFKQFVRDKFRTDLTNSARIREVLVTMQSSRLPPHRELHQKMSEFFAAATESP